MAEPWDDSALINAFNSAIAKYKTMHGLGVKGKVTSEGLIEDHEVLESDSHVVAKGNEYEVDKSELSQKDWSVPPLQANKLSSPEEGVTGNNEMEEVPAVYNSYTDPQSYPQHYAQHYGHSTTADNCYLCHWNAYYQRAGAWTSQGAPLNVLQCQYCGHVNQPEDATRNNNQTSFVSQTPIDASVFPDIIKRAVAEALETADGEKETGVMMESSQAHSSFSDVAVAWFLAGFHTSRYLSHSK